MARKLRNLLKNQTGQALVEYQILLPGAILLATLAGLMLSGPISDIYRHTASILLGSKECVVFDPVVQGNDFCDHHEDCEKGEWEEMDSGKFVYDDALVIETVTIKAGKTYTITPDDHSQFEFTTEDGCYSITFKTNKVSWDRIGSGSGCQSVSHVDVWQAPICE
ncbi:MAG: hypothetical protein IIC78_08750 [Chloroflexi bacterium]|nr:hypothetical protein [Chloroflexota bacterium]